VKAIDRYEILERLGDEERVTKYLAVDTQLPSHVRLKCAIYHYQLAPHIAVVPELWHDVLGKLEYIVELSRERQWLPTIYTYWTSDHNLYISCDAIDPNNLANLLARLERHNEREIILLFSDLLYLIGEIEVDGVPCQSLRPEHISIHPVDSHLVLNLAALSYDCGHPPRLLADVARILILAMTKNPQVEGWPERAPQITNSHLKQIIDRLYSDPSLTTEAAIGIVRDLLVADLESVSPPPLPPLQAAELEELLVRGMEKYALGEGDLAIEFYERALAIDPNCIVAYCGRGNAKRYQGDYEGSWQDFDHAVQIDRQYGCAYIGRALAQCMQVGASPVTFADFDRGVQLLENATDPIDYMMRGTARAQLNDLQGAITDYSEAIERYPGLTIAYNNRGNLQRSLGQYDQAMADMTRAIEISPNSAITYNNRGIIYADMQQFDRAIADYSQALTIDPSFAMAYSNRGNAHNDLSHYEDALIDYEQAISLQPNFAPAYSNRGNTYRLMERFAEAVADYDRAISLNPHLTIAVYNRGITRRQQGDHQGAIADYTEAINQDPHHLYAYYHRANARQYLGDKGGAIVDYTQVIRFNPRHTASYYNRGITRMATGDLDGALADLEFATQVQPDFTLGYYQQGYLHAKRGEHGAAIAAYTQAITLAPRYADAYYHRGTAYQETGDFNGAVADLSQTISIDSNYAPAYHQRAIIYTQLKDSVSALADYHRAARLYLDRGDTKMHQRIVQTIDRLTATAN
jgi:tetratricopeptide (TPR) repeat protein